MKTIITNNLTAAPTVILFALLLFISCADDPSPDTFKAEENMRINDSLTFDSIKRAEEEKPPPLMIKYRLDSLKDAHMADSLIAMYTEEQQKVIYAINRIEKVRVGAGSNLVIPDTLLTDFNLYSPFPQLLPVLDSIPKVVLIAQRIQAFALYEQGELLKWGPVSSGKLSTPTPNGLHYGNFKAKRKVSTVNKSWILPYYFNFMNFEGVGVHQYLLPGFPASHACVRLYMEDAEYIYNWANQWKLDPTGTVILKNGTPFMVFGEYDYESPYPWLELVENPQSNHLTGAEIQILKDYVEAYFLDDRNFVEEVEEIERELQS